MSDILEGIEGAECQVDNIIVDGCDQVQHDECLHAILKRLAEANVTLNLAKCEFSVTKVEAIMALLLLFLFIFTNSSRNLLILS